VRSEAAANRAEVARQSEEFKSTLLDAVAHEFKTPLTSIKAAASALLGSAAALPEALRELPAIIEEETDRLSVLVSQAARMAAIDAGTLQLERWPVHIDELCTRVVAQLAPYLEGREMRVEVPAGLPSVEADGDLIALALRQLLDNARKYAPPATPLELRAAPHRTSIVLTVRDHGETLAPRELERIFDRFYRREAVKRRVPGSGLGLHIAREIARAHGGELSAAAVADGGTIFTLELPLEGKA
jgi:two-component system sensor histidine kinase KdpD